MLEKMKKINLILLLAAGFSIPPKLEGLSNKRSLGSKIANKLARILHKNYSKLTDYLSGCFA